MFFYNKNLVAVDCFWISPEMPSMPGTAWCKPGNPTGPVFSHDAHSEMAGSNGIWKKHLSSPCIVTFKIYILHSYWHLYWPFTVLYIFTMKHKTIIWHKSLSKCIRMVSDVPESQREMHILAHLILFCFSAIFIKLILGARLNVIRLHSVWKTSVLQCCRKFVSRLQLSVLLHKFDLKCVQIFI